MIPGKKYGPEDYLRMAWNRRWLLVGPLLLTAIGTALVSFQLPNRYRAQTTILIVPQRVPENYVPSTVNTPLEDRLQMISQQILGRTRLERIIQEFNLYERERKDKDMIMEDIIEQMRTKDIKVGISGARSRRHDASAFTVGYESDNARTAMMVTERLAGLFIEENTNDRSVLADSTSQFLERQLEDARRRLMEHEKKLEEYRRRHQGSLPTELQSNLQAIQTTQGQMHALQDSLSRAQDRKTVIERQIDDLRLQSAAAPAPAPAPGSDPAIMAGQTAAQRLEAARHALTGMELRLKPEHPDIVRFKRVIKDLEKEAEKEALQTPLSEATPAAIVAGMSPAEVARQSRLSALQAEIATINRTLASGQQEQQRLSGLLNAYQQRVEATPSRESDLVALMRDYDTLKLVYTGLLAKNEASRTAAELQRAQIGEQFKIIDGARLPEKPVSPDRVRMNLMGAAAGLALGLALAFLFEWRDTTLKSEADVITALALPVLATVPAIETKKENLLRRRRRLVLSAGAAVLVMGTAAAIVWKLDLIERLVR